MIMLVVLLNAIMEHTRFYKIILMTVTIISFIPATKGEFNSTYEMAYPLSDSHEGYREEWIKGLSQENSTTPVKLLPDNQNYSTLKENASNDNLLELLNETESLRYDYTNEITTSIQNYEHNLGFESTEIIPTDYFNINITGPIINCPSVTLETKLSHIFEIEFEKPEQLDQNSSDQFMFLLQTFFNCNLQLTEFNNNTISWTDISLNHSAFCNNDTTLIIYQKMLKNNEINPLFKIYFEPNFSLKNIIRKVYLNCYAYQPLNKHYLVEIIVGLTITFLVMGLLIYFCFRKQINNIPAKHVLSPGSKAQNYVLRTRPAVFLPDEIRGSFSITNEGFDFLKENNG